MNIRALFTCLFVLATCFGNISGRQLLSFADEADDKEFKFVVAIFRAKKHICTGTLVNPAWVITSANCIDKFGTPNEVLVGQFDVGKRLKSGARKRGVIDVVFHPDFDDKDPFENDIAAIHLDSPVTTVETAQMNFDNNFDIDKVGFVFVVELELVRMGWWQKSVRSWPSPFS